MAILHRASTLNPLTANNQVLIECVVHNTYRPLNNDKVNDPLTNRALACRLKSRLALYKKVVKFKINIR